jgi:hypothetical protein
MLNPIASDHKGDLTKHSSIEIQYPLRQRVLGRETVAQ